MSNNWYMEEYKNKEFLHKKLLVFKSYEGEDGSHNHCEVCWARFSKYQGDYHSGYYEPMSSCWICPDCFNELAPLFGWIVE